MPWRWFQRAKICRDAGRPQVPWLRPGKTGGKKTGEKKWKPCGLWTPGVDALTAAGLETGATIGLF
jgi:hypothetical protein